MTNVSSLAELHPDQVHSRAGQSCKRKVEPFQSCQGFRSAFRGLCAAFLLREPGGLLGRGERILALPVCNKRRATGDKAWFSK